MDDKPEKELMFMGFAKGASPMPQYPCWLYREGTNPIVVSDTAAEAEARKNGYDSITAAAMSNKQLSNWFWDLEDMSPKQLRVYARDEYGVDLPEGASQQALFSAVCKLGKAAPQNRNRLVLMAHTIKMNYDATIEEIRRMISIPADVELETITEVIEL